MVKVIDYKENRTIIREYNNITELLKFLNTNNTNIIFRGSYCFSNREKENGWHETSGLDKAKEYLEYGYDTHFKEIKDDYAKVRNIIRKYESKKKISYKNYVEGFTPIVPNALLGLPYSMIKQERETKNTGSAKIYIDVGASCRFNTEEIIKYRALILAVVDFLQRKGIRCELYVVDTSYESNEIYIEKMKIKEYSQPLNIYKTQFPIISPDMTRRILFRTKEIEPEIKNFGWTGGYGCPLCCKSSISLGIDKKHNNSDDLHNLLGIEKEDIYFPSINEMENSLDDYEKLLETVIEKTALKQYISI